MPQTNRIPTGFLDLVGAETGGKNPPEYSELVGAGVDLTELLLGQTLCCQLNTVSHTAAGNTFGMTVQPDQAWLLRSVSVVTPLTNTAQLEEWTVGFWNLPRQEFGNDQSQIWTSRLMQVQVNGDTASDCFLLPQPILLTSGCAIYWTLRQRDTSAARNSTITAQFNLLRTGSR